MGNLHSQHRRFEGPLSRFWSVQGADQGCFGLRMNQSSASNPKTVKPHELLSWERSPKCLRSREISCSHEIPTAGSWNFPRFHPHLSHQHHQMHIAYRGAQVTMVDSTEPVSEWQTRNEVPSWCGSNAPLQSPTLQKCTDVKYQVWPVSRLQWSWSLNPLHEPTSKSRCHPLDLWGKSKPGWDLNSVLRCITSHCANVSCSDC